MKKTVAIFLCALLMVVSIVGIFSDATIIELVAYLFCISIAILLSVVVIVKQTTNSMIYFCLVFSLLIAILPLSAKYGYWGAELSFGVLFGLFAVICSTLSVIYRKKVQ